MNEVHPLLEREIGRVHLRITLCNGIYHGQLIEENEVIWTSRGQTSVTPIHQSAEEFLCRLPDSSELVEL